VTINCVVSALAITPGDWFRILPGRAARHVSHVDAARSLITQRPGSTRGAASVSAVRDTVSLSEATRLAAEQSTGASLPGAPTPDAPPAAPDAGARLDIYA